MDSFNKYYRDLVKTIELLPEQFQSLDRASKLIAKGDQIICVGVGKSGFVAEKLNASLCSISVNSSFLHPSEAVHGDIGKVLDRAVVVVISKSGNSDEINALIPLFRKRQCKIIAICNRRESILGDAADIYIDTSVDREGEPLNILPLISVDVSMVIANMLVGEVSQLSRLTVDRFAQNHPGGQLGRNVSLTLNDLVEWKLRRPFVLASTTVIDAIIVDSEHRAGLVCVLDQDGKMRGVVSDGDIRRAIRDDLDLKNIAISDIMNRNPITLNPSLLVGGAIDIMETPVRKVFSAPVIDDDDVCKGVLTLHDLIRK